MTSMSVRDRNTKYCSNSRHGSLFGNTTTTHFPCTGPQTARRQFKESVAKYISLSLSKGTKNFQTEPVTVHLCIREIIMNWGQKFGHFLRQLSSIQNTWFYTSSKLVCACTYLDTRNTKRMKRPIHLPKWSIVTIYWSETFIWRQKKKYY